MKIFIRSSSCISPQNTFGQQPFLKEPVAYHATRLHAIAPDYNAYIDPKLIRRMSHIIKMGVAAAQECLRSGGTAMPGAIVTGTALGCLEDTVTFLMKLIESNEEMLPPTPFIQSTHNTVAAQIALLLKCHAYNNTFVHKGISFESALFDAILLLKENEADNILVGGADELTDVSFAILSRLGLYRRQVGSNLSLFETNCKGTIGGEGAVFFLLTDKVSIENLVELCGTQTFYRPVDVAEIEGKIVSFLAQHDLQIGDIDLVITGRNGDKNNDAIYDRINKSLFSKTALANYKHLSGEYPTSPAFALWLASQIIKKEKVPEVVIEKKINNNIPGKILIYNHYLDIYHSLMLVSAC